MDEEEELENMLIGRNQRRTNKRPEEIQAEQQNALPDKRSGVEKLLDESLTPTEAVGLAAPAVIGAKTSIPFLSRGAAFLGMPKLAAFTGGYALGNAIDNNLNISGGIAKAYESLSGGVDQPAFTAAPTLQALADQKAQGAMTEDDKVDNLQSALQSVPDTPQVVPGTLPTAQESGQRLIDAAKEFYPGAFPAAAPAAPAVPGLSPDALQAIQSPSIPESVTSSEVPAGLGPMRPVDPRTGEFLSPEVIAAGEGAGLTFPSQVALPQAQAPASIPPMSEAETRARLQQQFGAPTLSQIQALSEGQGRGIAVDAQGRMQSTDRGEFDDEAAEREARVQDRDRRPGESQTERDTRLADEKLTRSTAAEGRMFTDSELRRAFGDGYQEARIKDANGINPFTDVSYEKERLDRENLIADTEYRKKSGVEDSPSKIIEDARAQAEAMAEASGLSPDDPDYEDFILDSMETITGIPRYRKPIPRLTDAEANALYEKGEIDADYEYINEKGERVKYVPEKKAAKSERRRDRRSRAAEARKNR